MISQFSFPPSSLARLPPSSSSLPARGDEPTFHVSVGSVPFLLWGSLHPPSIPSSLLSIHPTLPFGPPAAPGSNSLPSWDPPSASTPSWPFHFPSNTTFYKDTAVLGLTFPEMTNFRIQSYPEGKEESPAPLGTFGIGFPSSSAPLQGGLCLNILAL